MKVLRLALAALVCSAPLLASAQWIWLDQSGRKVFSDQAPPPDVPANRIVKQPGQRAAPPAADAAAAAAPSVQAAATAPAGKDKELETKKKEAESAAAAKRRAQDEQLAAARTDNCARARSGKVAYESGQRISRINDKGEREYMSDEDKAREVKRLDGIIASDCK